jgi:TolB-like protein/predicted Ser/Thr protein kinase
VKQVGESGDELASAATLDGPAGPMVIGARYEVLGFVGAGGMGSVYRVRDRALDEVVALKLVAREWGSAARADRLQREVKLARRVTHRNVARTFDIGDHGAERFLTMEYVDGESLAQLLAREGALSERRATEVARAIAYGLTAAHEVGVIHRDLKPDNVLLERSSGRIVITDFGVARGLDAAQRTQGVIGTPAYMAPEQVEGGDVDARADLYALGAVLYEMLTGAPAWEGASIFAVAAARLSAPPPDPRARIPSISSTMADLVRTLMARQRDHRPARASEVSQWLGEIVLHASSSTSHAGPANSAARAARIAPVPAADKTVAVLPFRAAAEDALLAEELTEDLIDRLSMTAGLRVRHLAAVHAAIQTDDDPRAIGRVLDVAVIVECVVRRKADAVRVTARAVSVEEGFQIWATRFEGAAGELLAMNDRIARAVSSALAVSAGASERTPMTDPHALELYVNARQALRRSWAGSPPLPPVVAAFDAALALAPDDPLILSGAAMARARWLNFDLAVDADTFAEARRMTDRALERAPSSGEPWLARATLQHLEGDWPAAVGSLRRALARVPGLVKAQEMLGAIQVEVGPIDDGLYRLEAARALDPEAPAARMDLIRAHALLGEWSRVEALYGEAPHADAIASIIALRISAWGGSHLVASPIESEPLAELYAAFRLGAEGVERVLAFAHGARPRSRLRPLFFQIGAELAMKQGGHDTAIAAVVGATESWLYDLQWLDRCPLLGPIRADPRFRSARETIEARARLVHQALAAPLV